MENICFEKKQVYFMSLQYCNILFRNRILVLIVKGKLWTCLLDFLILSPEEIHNFHYSISQMIIY